MPVEEFSDDKFIFMATRKGITKKTNLSLFARKWKSGIKAINLDEDDILDFDVIYSYPYYSDSNNDYQFRITLKRDTFELEEVKAIPDQDLQRAAENSAILKG